MRLSFVVCVALFASYGVAAQGEEAHPSVSGIYPHLAMFNDEGECGTGAVVPWADRLWVITYGPHLPNGSSDKLYEITPDLEQIVRPESVGGTPANRMIHRESQQLFIGPYVIDDQRTVRVIPPKAMFGRLTGNARHLTDPANRIYYATMEEGFYDVDVHTLAVTELYQDGNRQKDHGGALLPGYHGKGLYSSQGRLVYANNGENSDAARQRPDIDSGVLAEWSGKDWTVVRRNQFTEVTGPGGIYGNDKTTDPLWSIGWDHKSLILMVLDGGKWTSFRLAKSSHSYDGAHGWNTEWPRIREIGGGDLLMTMHGAFWSFPRGFSSTNTAGIAPRSNYLKVIGDFARWNDRVVFGCDDTAHNEFLNKRKAKGNIAGPQSQSNLWFVSPDEIDHLGPVIGRGALWLNEELEAGTVTDPFLVNGYDRRSLYLSHADVEPTTIEIEGDRLGNGRWEPVEGLPRVELPARGAVWKQIPNGWTWIRLKAPKAMTEATAMFQLANKDSRVTTPSSEFDGLAQPYDKNIFAGILRSRDKNKRTLSLVTKVSGGPIGKWGGYYELDADLKLKAVDDAETLAYTTKNASTASGIMLDEHSVIFEDDDGKRWRLPQSNSVNGNPHPLGDARIVREVATERDLFNGYGTFYELPAENAGGFSKIRPVATHNRWIHDFCSYRGMLVMTGISSEKGENNPHIIRSDDGQAAVWVGAIDDVWKLGKPIGEGGPWHHTSAKANVPSDPYLLTGYDERTIRLSHSEEDIRKIRIEIDITGTGIWKKWQTFEIPAGKKLSVRIPDEVQGYWLRAVATEDGSYTVMLKYE
jgi:hypothetical protein